MSAAAASSSTVAAPASPTTPVVITSVLTREVVKSTPLYRLRKRTMVPFGKATSNDNDNATAVEMSAPIALGKVDAVEKSAVDAITAMMQASLAQNVVSPTAKRLKAKAADELAKAAAAAPAPALAAVTSSGGGDDGGEKKALSWGEARRLRAEQGGGAQADARGGRATGPSDGEGKATRRTGSGKIIDPLVVRVRNLCDVTVEELQRLFGPDNNLGRIAKMYLAPADKGMAYISYKSEAEAVQAIQKMDKRKFKNLILSVDHGTVNQKRQQQRR